MGQHFKAIIFDMDGVFWRDDVWLVDPADVFHRLKAAGIRFALATNNATRPVDHYLRKFAQRGAALEAWQVIHSALATAEYLAARFPQSGEMYVVGEAGLVSALEGRGFRIGSTDPLAVVCGLDRQINYEKLETATLLIRRGVPFIGTNPDRSFPVPQGEVPGAGAILAAIQAATDVEPLIIGKPQTAMYEQLLPALQASPAETLVIGDRLETDIAGGQALGCLTACVLSGVSTPDQVRAWQPQPNFVAADLASLLESLGL